MSGDLKTLSQTEDLLETAVHVRKILSSSYFENYEKSPVDIDAVAFSPSDFSGDWWGYFELANGNSLVLLGDATGHGIRSGMVCAYVKGYVESFVKGPGRRPSELLKELNDLICRISKGFNLAMTMAAVEINYSDQVLIYSNAGHPAPIFLTAKESGSTPAFLVCQGSVLGLDLSAHYSNIRVPFVSGDRLLLYSDGLPESQSPEGAVYGEGRLLRRLKAAHKTEDTRAVHQYLIFDVLSHMGNSRVKDDLTSVLIRYK
jgi:sigma-B regulation protein RsbU (phosphoserine phosphatase)